MFKNILVPTDCGPNSEETIGIALDLAKVHGSRVSLLHVVEMLKDVGFDELEDFYTGLETKARSTLARLAAGFEAHNLKCSCQVAFGHRLEQILKFSNDGGCDLIILHSHRVDPARQRFGTLSYQVAVLAQCPVMLVK